MVASGVGESARIIFKPDAPIGELAWSHSEDKISFSAYVDGDHEIYSMDIDGGNVKRLTFGKGNDVFPSWSPDDEFIGFVNYSSSDAWEARLTGESDVYIMRSDGTGKERLTFSPDRPKGPLIWSEDRKSLWYFLRDGRSLYNVNILTKQEQHLLELDNSFHSIDMKNQRVAFLPKIQGRRVMVCDLEGKRKKVLADFNEAWVVFVRNVQWIKDGKKLVCTVTDGKKDKIVVVDPESGEKKVVASVDGIVMNMI